MIEMYFEMICYTMNLTYRIRKVNISLLSFEKHHMNFAFWRLIIYCVGTYIRILRGIIMRSLKKSGMFLLSIFIFCIKLNVSAEIVLTDEEKEYIKNRSAVRAITAN